MRFNFVKPERISLKHHPELDEKWLEDRIAEDTSLLGLGDLIVKDRQRDQPRGGRLDLLLQDQDEERIKRYEVEIQLGATDESHIIRTIEYWDKEQKLYPDYSHTAVIVAEDITGRFHNVISLFNRSIPLIALQISAHTIGDSMFLVCTKVLDTLPHGGDDDELDGPVDRGYWEQRVSTGTMSILDDLFSCLKALDPEIELHFNKSAVRVAKHGALSHAVVFRPRQAWLRVEVQLDQTEEIDSLLETAGFDLMSYNNNKGRYRIQVNQNDLTTNKSLLQDLMARAYRNIDF